MTESVYDRLGVRKVILGKGWYTSFGGSIMHPEVLQAMTDAAPYFVDMVSLHARAGEVIAWVTGAEAGLVTAGAAAALALAAAACMTGPDPAKAARLPDTTGLKNEIVLQKSQRNRYDGAFRLAGARIVEVGDQRATRIEQLAQAITDRTAAVAYVKSVYVKDPLPVEQIIRVAHEHGVPVIVDAAPAVPPAPNLTRYIELAADLVIFSGGKGIGGPQSTGILCGRKDLVRAATMNALTYNEPKEGIGRPMKVCKEEIIGLVAALERFGRVNHETERDVWTARARVIVDALQGIPGVRACLEDDMDHASGLAVIYLEPARRGLSGPEIVSALQRGDPPIEIGFGLQKDGLWVVPVSLLPGDEWIVARRLREELVLS